MAEMLGDPPERARVLAVSHDERRPARGLRVRDRGHAVLADRRRGLREHPRGHDARASPTTTSPPATSLDSYLAVAMRGSAGGRIGYIGVQSRRRLDPNVDERAALSIFGARAAAEIERRRHEVALRAREAEIAASRVRIVEAADEERRRIGRNLHDGAQQRLVALGHMLAMAGRRLAEEPDSRGRAARPGARAGGAGRRRAARARARAAPGRAGRARARPRAGVAGHALAAAAAPRRAARAPAARSGRGDGLLPGLRGADQRAQARRRDRGPRRGAPAGPEAAGRRPRRRPRRRAGERGHGPRGPGRSRHRGRRDAARREPARGGHAPGGDDHAGARGAPRASRSSSSATATTAGWATACSRWCSTGARR